MDRVEQYHAHTRIGSWYILQPIPVPTGLNFTHTHIQCVPVPIGYQVNQIVYKLFKILHLPIANLIKNELYQLNNTIVRT
jgi:hypothetical protein